MPGVNSSRRAEIDYLHELLSDRNRLLSKTGKGQKLTIEMRYYTIDVDVNPYVPNQVASLFG